MTKKFLRQDYMRHSKLGRNRKKIQRWRRPRGRHSKMRKLRGSYPTCPSVGYRTPRKMRANRPILVHNLNELKEIDKGKEIILASVGAKKKLSMIRMAEEKGLTIKNVRSGKKHETR